jgi:hypothetical protein
MSRGAVYRVVEKWEHSQDTRTHQECTQLGPEPRQACDLSAAPGRFGGYPATPATSDPQFCHEPGVSGASIELPLSLPLSRLTPQSQFKSSRVHYSCETTKTHSIYYPARQLLPQNTSTQH